MAKRDGTITLPPGIWALGLVSFFMDMSSELVHSLMPLLIVGELGAGGLALGLIEGLAEATAQGVKVFSGTLSDWWGRRKQLVLAGYGLAALSKPLFPLASSLGWVLTARITDRIGKGIRGSPRDALIADMVPAEQRGRAFGLRQSLDTWGAVAGPFLAIVLMAAWGNIRGVLWVAVLPALACFLCILIFVPDLRAAPRPAVWPLSKAGLKALGAPFWWVTLLGFLLSLTRFSEAFLLLRAKQQGLADQWVPGVMILMSVVYAVGAYPAGVAADRISKWQLLTWGMLVMALANAFLAFADTLWGVGLGVACWGLHMALTQGLMSFMVANTAPSSLKATAFGCFNLATAVALVIASAVAGELWDSVGRSGPFLFGLAACLSTLAAIAWIKERLDALEKA